MNLSRSMPGLPALREMKPHPRPGARMAAAAPGSEFGLSPELGSLAMLGFGAIDTACSAVLRRPIGAVEAGFAPTQTPRPRIRLVGTRSLALAPPRAPTVGENDDESRVGKDGTNRIVPDSNASVPSDMVVVFPGLTSHRTNCITVAASEPELDRPLKRRLRTRKGKE
ncbi:hypothetical protein DCS_02588 [Drechmeria coniospora]|uniref:Uncharacterized protein n=1 Tax=Drechmeria coniospora TaxID=98403 RepID=A0A151GWG0_DRECN|nr:hypothetical protein DCS_02588 [Drechmeria coniospora]KYK61446.1 hypothetical protein DCS_02588 [Drechmeria coniospora]